ncbi:MAG: NnrU family protein [Hyphomonadaceae bacterium]|nr:NnrU family protein [Hyphomonadaceae bacterium]
MNGFAWALAGFVLLHVGVSASGLRGVFVRAIGEWPYRGLFSLASLGLLVWLVTGYGAMRADPFDPLNEALWAPADWVRGVGAAINLFGVTLAAAGVLTPGPTYAGFESKSLEQPEPARGVLRITRHPFLWGVALWALGHLLANGERASLMLFGALGFMAVFGARSIDRKGRARNPEAWARFEDATSNFPFAAIAQGRNRLAPGEIGWRMLAGLLVALAVAVWHETLFGAAVIP